MASYFPRSSGSVPLPNSHLDFPFLCPKYPWPTLFVVYSLRLSKVSCKDTLSGFEASQDPGCSSFFSPYFAPLALISCKQGCTTPCSPQFQLLFSYWPTVLSREYLFWGSLIFRFLRHSLLPPASFHKNADTMQVFEPPVASTSMNFGVCGAVLSPSFVIDVCRFLVLLSQLLCGFVVVVVCLLVLFCFVFNGGVQGD